MLDIGKGRFVKFWGIYGQGNGIYRILICVGKVGWWVWQGRKRQEIGGGLGDRLVGVVCG